MHLIGMCANKYAHTIIHLSIHLWTKIYLPNTYISTHMDTHSHICDINIVCMHTYTQIIADTCSPKDAWSPMYASTLFHTLIYICLCAETQIYTHTHRHKVRCMYIHSCAYSWAKCTHTCTYTSEADTCSYIHMCMYSELHIDIYTQTIAKAHTDTHRHTYTLVNTDIYAHFLKFFWGPCLSCFTSWESSWGFLMFFLHGDPCQMLSLVSQQGHCGYSFATEGTDLR